MTFLARPNIGSAVLPTVSCSWAARNPGSERPRVLSPPIRNHSRRPIEERATDLRAVCFQHEVDHLDGVLFIDRISRLKRTMYAKKRKKQLRYEEEDAGPSRSGNTL